MNITNIQKDLISTSIQLSDNWSTYKNTLSKNLISTNNRKRRNLNKEGKIEMKFITTHQSYQKCLNAGFKQKESRLIETGFRNKMNNENNKNFYRSMRSELGDEIEVSLYCISKNTSLIIIT